MDSDTVVRSIDGIYDRYRIIPNLRVHMKKVAAVGELVMDSWSDDRPEMRKVDVVAALLLHDIGNIVKFNFGDPVMWQGYTWTDMEYWKVVRDEVAGRYGSTSDHDVTSRMVEELGLDGRSAFLVRNMLLENIEFVLRSGDFELKICTYADQRVAPSGVVCIRERFEDLRRRYAGRPEFHFRPEGEALALRLEKQIFSRTTISPEAVNEESIARYLRP